jgi:CBS domain-containing protein
VTPSVVPLWESRRNLLKSSFRIECGEERGHGHTDCRRRFSEGFVSVGEYDALSSCLSVFKEEMPPVLVVLDGESKYAGVITRRWIIRSRLDPSMTKVKTLTRPAPAISLHDSLSRAARLTIESEIRQLPARALKKCNMHLP